MTDYLKLNCQIERDDYLGVDPEFSDGELGIFINQDIKNGDAGEVIIALSPQQVKELIVHLTTVYGQYLQERVL